MANEGCREGGRSTVLYWVLRSQECWERGTVGTRKETDTEEGSRATENPRPFLSTMYTWPWPRLCTRQRTGEEVRVRRDTQTFNLESIQRYSCPLRPHQTYANGNGNKLR